MLIRTSRTDTHSFARPHFLLSECDSPFAPGDVTAGSEDELQAVVLGRSECCDLPISVRESRFYSNLVRRISSGEAPRQNHLELEKFLNDSGEVWENSWVRFPEDKLSPHALDTFHADLGLRQQGSTARRRTDITRYILQRERRRWLRVPISYALKLALADLIGTQPHLHERLRSEAERLLTHFSNDNTSPETTSFHVSVSVTDRSASEEIAREAARRFLVTTLLMNWANQRFGLRESGQRGLVYHGPHPPVRQTELSACTSDAFYRELFMSPCLSGWSDGESKSEYMHLCHQVLSRSQLNAVAKLREAGIISNNLIVLPSLSNVSLANNGIHVSMGSRALGRTLRSLDPESAIAEEKRIGDLAIKIFEHFLPLFVGTYSAAPYRIDFQQFHPERLLGFLPHELDFTHLRLMWREWKEKANLRVLGRPVTPYGPPWIDSSIATTFRLRGDLVPDYRLLSYPVAWLSTEQASALDGIPGNTAGLAEELDQLGIVDKRMSFYMPLRLRHLSTSGYSGFEARYYSLFPSYDRDMAPAMELQQLLLAVAYRMAITGAVTPDQVPDDPTAESERRQAFFFSAAGLPAFYVHKRSRNQLLVRVLRHCANLRSSWRHPEYLRVSLPDFRLALLNFLNDTAGTLIEDFSARVPLIDLRWRLADNQKTAGGRLTSAIVDLSGERDAMRMNSNEFNRLAETYYRDQLREAQLAEALAHLREDVLNLHAGVDPDIPVLVRCAVRVQDPIRFLDSIGDRIYRDELSLAETTSLLNLLLILSARDHGNSHAQLVANG